MRIVVLGVLAACGDGVAVSDAPRPSDANAGLVRLQVVGGDDRGGLTAVFQARDSTTVLATETDAQGRANAFMEPDGFVTVATSQGSTIRLFTYAGVQPGDELRVALGPSTDEVTSVRLRVPAAPDAVYYQLQTECGTRDVRGAEAPLGLDVTLQGCPSTSDMLVYAVGNRTTYLHAEDVALHGSSVHLEGTYQELATATATIVNVPPTVPRVLVSQGPAAGAADLYPDPDPDILMTTGEPLTAVAETALPPDGTLRTTITPLDAAGAQHVIDWRPVATDVTVDVQRRRVRTATSPPRYDHSANAIVWTDAADGDASHLVYAVVRWSSASSGNGVWTIVAPGGDEPIVRLPLLPYPELQVRGEAFGPAPLASIVIDGIATRARTQLIGRWQPGDAWPIEGDAGTVAYRDLAETIR